MIDLNAAKANSIFKLSIEQYHIHNDVDQEFSNPFVVTELESLLYRKNWIDTVQWHLEDIIRSPEIAPAELVAVKRRIDASNQDRTDMVELIDANLFDLLRNVKKEPNARMNSETPAWLLDRMSILQLKIYHFKEQLYRPDASDEHLDSVAGKLKVLQEQEADLAQCFNELFDDLKSGKKYMKRYQQMKMYNDPSLNPVLYGEKK
ncbi:Nap binding protein NBP1 [Spirosomataceae bacterium TFI 002]|nr:Nap binding protein NBP1 [Spirosomataceae bacterium TFI 002]